MNTKSVEFDIRQVEYRKSHPADTVHMQNYKRPEMPELILFIEQTHSCEKLKVKHEDISTLLKQGAKAIKPNPYVVGHFDALNYLFTLVGEPHFPCKDVRLLTNQYKSEEALHWLRKLHELMAYPCAKMASTPEWEDEIRNCRQQDCGVYRIVPEALAFAYAPTPEQIPLILHLWLKDLTTLHEEVKNLLDNPYGISRNKTYDMHQACRDTNLLFCNLLPFSYGSNRLGRLVENLLRLNWQLPWSQVPGETQYQNYVRDIQDFQSKKLPKYLERIKELR